MSFARSAALSQSGGEEQITPMAIRLAATILHVLPHGIRTGGVRQGWV